jgi:hypothetical protein
MFVDEEDEMPRARAQECGIVYDSQTSGRTEFFISMKKPVIKPEPVSALLMSEAIPTLDGQGLLDDAKFLLTAKWLCPEDEEDHVLFTKASGTLMLRASQDDDNVHRLKWELTIHANNAQVGYAAIVLRPGDMNGSTTGRLIKEALDAAEEEFKKWSDALAEARRQLEDTKA